MMRRRVEKIFEKLLMMGLSLPTKLFAVIFLGLVSNLEAYPLIPTADSDFYYRMGGGAAIPDPSSNTQISLGAESEVGLGYNCGIFDPKVSLQNSLNGIGHSFQAVSEQVLAGATAALATLPLYALARANPPLYNLINNGLSSARQEFELSTRSCEDMQDRIAEGKNPYTHWMSLSMNQDWKNHMSQAEFSPFLNSTNTPLLSYSSSSDVDLNQVRQEVTQNNGKNGVLWIQGISKTGGHYAGGLNQPPIQVVHDTAIAGYKILTHRQLTRTGNVKIKSQDPLLTYFPTAEAASSWITHVVGEQTITTYSNGPKTATPGLGLLPYHQQESEKLSEALTALIQNKTQLDLVTLQAVSAPHLMINSSAIEILRRQAPVLQSILVGKLAEDIATARLIDQAQRALQILQVGSQIPVIYSNAIAQSILEAAMKRLRQEMEDLLFIRKMNQEVVSPTLVQLFKEDGWKQQQAASFAPQDSQTSTLDQGALPTNSIKGNSP